MKYYEILWSDTFPLRRVIYGIQPLELTLGVNYELADTY